MTELGSITDYVGRTVDLLAFQGQTLNGEVKLDQQLVAANEGGELCTGVQKLAQRWLMEFLTIRGSIQYLPDRGCDFLGQVRRGELHTTLDAEQAFFLSVQQVKANLQSEETVETLDDEAYAAVELETMTISGDQLTLRVDLLSAAGTTARAILPINVQTG